MPAVRPAKYKPPQPPDWSGFAVDPESAYYADREYAASLAERSATELAGYLASARLLEMASREGKNPLVRGGRRWTPGQSVELKEAISEARMMADGVFAECSCAFGDAGAERLREYVERRLDAEMEYSPDPTQQDLF